MTARERFVAWADEHPVALWLRFCAVSIAIAIGLTASIASCGYVEQLTPQQQTDRVLSGLISACDVHGNRIYTKNGNSAVAVAVQDPTCRAAS